MSLGPDVASGALNMEDLAITREQKGGSYEYIYLGLVPRQLGPELCAQ